MASDSDGASSQGKFRGEMAVGKRVGVFWDGDEAYFFGTVVSYKPQRTKKQYRVKYDDGETFWEYGDALDFRAAENKARGKMSSKPLKRKRPRTPPTMQGDQSDGEEKPTEPEKSVKQEVLLPTQSTATDDRETKMIASSNDVEMNAPKDHKSILSRKQVKEEPDLISLLGRRCKVFWNGEGEYFYGKVVKTSASRGKALVSYDDGDREWEAVNEIHIISKGTDGKEVATLFSEAKPSETSSSVQSPLRKKTKRAKEPMLEEPPKTEEKHLNRNDSVLHHQQDTSEIPTETGSNLKKSDNEEILKRVDDPTREMRGQVAVGYKVEFFQDGLLKGRNEDKQSAEVIAYDKDNDSYVVALTTRNQTVQEIFTLDGKENFVKTFLEQSKYPLVVGRVLRGDVQSVAKLLNSNPRVVDSLCHTEEGIFHQVLKKTPPNVKTEMLKMLLDQVPPISCDLETCLILLQRCVESFKDHILLKLVISRIQIALRAFPDKEASSSALDEIYRYCVDHILRLNAEDALDKVDQVLMAVLYDKTIGFSLDRRVALQGVGGTGCGKIQDARGGTIAEGTPLVHAIARGNISMAKHLMETEKQRNDMLSRKHWTDLKLNEQFSGYVDEWGLIGSPVHLVLFFFIVAKSFSGPHSLTKILMALVRMGKVNLNAQTSASAPPLLFLCSQTEKKLQIRIREAILQLLAAGADPNITDVEGTTPLLACVKNKTPRFIKLFFQNDNKTNPNLSEPLKLACELGHQEEIEALLSVGAVFTSEMLNQSEGKASQAFRERHSTLDRMLASVPNKEERQMLLDRLLIDTCHNEYPDEKLVLYLLDLGAQIDVPNRSGDTVIMLCIRKGHVAMLHTIMRATGVDVNELVVPQNNQPLLVWACSKGEQPIIKALLDSSGSTGGLKLTNINKEQKPKSDAKTKTPLGETMALLNNVKQYSSSEKQVMNIGDNFAPTRRTNRLGIRSIAAKNALVAACESGNAELVKTLINSGSDIIEVNCLLSETKWTPLHLASGLGLAQVVAILLEHGADTSLLDTQGRSALCWAAVAGERLVVRLLVTKGNSDLSLRDNSGLTPLDLAIRHGNSEVAIELVQLGATLDNIALDN